MDACTQQFVDRSSATVRLRHSFANLDSCVDDAFFLFFGVWIRLIGAIFSLPQLTIDLADTPTMPARSRHRSSISLTSAPGTISNILFAKHVSFQYLVSSPYPVFTSREEKKRTWQKLFSTQSTVIFTQAASSCPISPHFAAGAVGVGCGAATSLATESTGTVLVPRLMTRIAGHVMELISAGDEHKVGGGGGGASEPKRQ